MKHLFVSFCVLAVLLTGMPSAFAQPTILPAYSFEGGPDFVLAQGSWIGDTNRDPFFRDFPFQCSEIRCDKVRGICLEARAVWQGTMMFSDLIEYKVHEWDQDKVIAVLDGAAATIELRFDLKKKMVLLAHTEKPELPNPRKLQDFAHLGDGMKAIEKAKRR